MPATPNTDKELVLDRLIDAPRDKVYRCWTEPDLIKQWFAPKPWTTPKVEIDVRPGGASTVTMADPEGNEYPNPGIYLEVVPDEKLVFTDSYSEGWKPAAEPFMTAILLLADAPDGGTSYTAIARHRNPDARKTHEDMGFADGWGTVATQLEAYAKGLGR